MRETGGIASRRAGVPHSELLIYAAEAMAIGWVAKRDRPWPTIERKRIAELLRSIGGCVDRGAAGRAPGMGGPAHHQQTGVQ
jgi:hypothetical protein